MTPPPTVIQSNVSPSSSPDLRLRVSSQLLGDHVSIHEGLLAPKELVPPHTHAFEDQCLYVVWGDVHLEIGGEFVEATAGTYVIKPRGVPHALWNPGSDPALVLEISTPGGFESFYNEMPTANTDDERNAVMKKHGMTFHEERIPELTKRYGLS